VIVDLITTDGQAGVLKNLKRKTEAADKMFEHLVTLMWDELKIKRVNDYTKKEEIPSWL
jgi:catabolite regulation protein CreA